MGRLFKKVISIKAKDTPWDADLTGSAVCTVGAKIRDSIGFSTVTLNFCNLQGSKRANAFGKQ